MFGIDIPAISTLLLLTSGAPSPVACEVKDVPMVDVLPMSREIQYDYSHSSEELAQIYKNPNSPFPANYDTATGGLRIDTPTISIQVSTKMESYEPQGQSCFWYDRVRVDITLDPKIYIANDFGDAICQSEIKRHELKHIDVDRRVMNKYAVLINESIHNEIAATGAVGPVRTGQYAAIQKKMQDAINKAVMSWQGPLQAEMARLQKDIDSLQEYRRISKICNRSRY